MDVIAADASRRVLVAIAVTEEKDVGGATDAVKIPRRRLTPWKDTPCENRCVEHVAHVHDRRDFVRPLAEDVAGAHALRLLTGAGESGARRVRLQRLAHPLRLGACGQQHRIKPEIMAERY